MCVAAVQWSRNCLRVQINRVRLPATLFSVSLYLFFIVWSLFLNTSFPSGLFVLTLFFLWPFFLHSYCWPCWPCTWINIYFKLKAGVLFWKRDFKCSWSAYWSSLRPEKKQKLSNPRNRNSISVIKSKFLSVSSMNTLLAILTVTDARHDVILGGGLYHRFPWRHLPPPCIW